MRQDFKRGQIETDERSNSIIVTNTRETIERIRRLVKELDVALPQVLIDSKIVIANEDFSRNVGVNWGGQMQGTGQSGAGFVSNAAAIPNLAGFSVVGPQSANGLAGAFSFGTSATKNLNLTLQLAEINKWSKTLSSPRVIVNNKKTATVNDGENRVILTQGGVGQAGDVRNIEANLKLTVTPQVTSSGSVLLDVKVDKTAFLSASNDNKTTKSLETNVLVDSGSTLVLGGVYQYSKSLEDNGVPLLKDLPFVGQLFRTNSNAESKSELMIFISPQILDPNTPDLGAETASVTPERANLEFRPFCLSDGEGV
jgi:type IV pilus assembly protein PilQ